MNGDGREYIQFGNLSMEGYLQIISVGADESGITETFRQLYPNEWIEITNRVDKSKAIPYFSYYDEKNDSILSEQEVLSLQQEEVMKRYNSIKEEYFLKKITIEEVPIDYRAQILREFEDLERMHQDLISGVLIREQISTGTLRLLDSVYSVR